MAKIMSVKQALARPLVFGRRFSLALLAACGFVLLAGFVAESFGASSAMTEVQLQNATVIDRGSLQISDAACSVTGPQTAYDATNNLLQVNVDAGAIGANCLGLEVLSTGTNGYTLAIDGPDDGQLKLADQAILPVVGTLEAPTSFATSGEASAWGFAMPSGQIKGLTLGFDASYAVLAPSNTTNTANYAAVPSDFQPISTTTAPNGQAGGGAANGDHYDFFFAASAGENVPTGTYTGVVTISGYGNTATPPPDIQTFTADNCPTTRTMVRDARDNHTYWIRKIPNTRSLGGSGDLCWMETNLAYAGGVGDGGTDAYGDVINDLVEGSAANNIADGQPCYDPEDMDFFKTKCYWVPLNANPSISPNSPVETTDGGADVEEYYPDPRAQYGYIYSYCTAMNGQTAACSTSDSSQPNQQANPGKGTAYNICPAGWRLPTGESTTGEFTLLNSSINDGTTSGTNADAGLLSNGLYMYSGVWWAGFSGQGSIGFYWSSTTATRETASSFFFNDMVVDPALSLDAKKGAGYAVRCVADPEPVLTTEAPTGADMQEIVGNQTAVTDRIKYHCPTTRTQVRDARNNNTYWIRRIENTNGLGDGQGTGSAMCWMETNLAYEGGTSNGGVSTYGDVINDLVEGSAANNNIGSSQACYGDNTTMNASKTKCYWVPTGANPTSDNQTPSESTDGGATNPQYGYLYSWCAAMNGQTAACSISDSSQPNQSANPGNGTMYNICPAGWRLPTGEATTGEYAKLATALGWTSGGPQSSLFANGLYMYSGVWGNGSFGGQGSSGYYWSSTVYYTAYAHSLRFGSSSVSPASDNNRSYGQAVRCVVP